jgi:hypothetical protein
MLAMGSLPGSRSEEGVHTLLGPNPVTRPNVACAALAFALLVKAVAWLRTAGTPPDAGADATFGGASGRFGPDRVAAALGLPVALAGVIASERFGMLRADGVASLLIGLTLAGLAVRLIGASGDASLIADILGRAGQAGLVDGVNEVRTLQLGPS